MKKILLIIFIFMVFLLSGESIFAEDFGITVDPPSGSEEFFEENEINISEPESIIKITPAEVFKYMWKEFKGTLSMPLKTLGIMIIVIMISAAMKNTGDTVENKNLTTVYDTISVLICVGAVSTPVINTIDYISETLFSGGNFMVSYIPIFSGVVAAGGNVSTAGVYHVILLAVCEIFTQVTTRLFMPLISICMAMSVIESINPAISLSGIISAVKKFTTWGIGLIMTIFVGLLTLQSIIGTSADTVAVKAGKFLVSNFVPVIGGAISDAYTTIKGSLSILRSGVGIFGIIGLAVVVLPPICSAVAMILSVNVAQIAADIFNVKQISGFLKNISDILTSAMSLLLCFTLMLVISTTVVMMVGMNME